MAKKIFPLIFKKILPLVLKKGLFLILNLVKFTLILLITILITYSILFSVGSTLLIYKGYKLVNSHLQEVITLKSTNPVQTEYMKNYRITLSEKGLADTLSQKFIPLDSISENLKMSVLAAEDDGFYIHPGIDLESILQAMKHNRSRGEIKRGGSTITQQLAKNLFLNKKRNFSRKLKELGYSLLMEHYLGKDRIFELYLNYAQWGTNIFGCEAAAQHYYNKSSKNLTKFEASRLAAILAMPSRLSPHNYKSSFMNKRLSVIANNLYLHKTIGDSDYFNITGTVHPSVDSAALELKPSPDSDSTVITTAKPDKDTLISNSKTRNKPARQQNQ